MNEMDETSKIFFLVLHHQTKTSSFSVNLFLDSDYERTEDFAS
jgi:hypothetical protein